MSYLVDTNMLTELRRKQPDPAVVRQNSALQFLEAFIREPLTVGSLWPSSAALARVTKSAL